MRKTGCKQGIACIIIAFGLSLTACSSIKETFDKKLSNKKADYRTSRSLPSLEVPPDLASPSGANAIEVPHTGTATYSEYAQGKGTRQKPSNVVLPEFTDIHVMQNRDVRWLVIKASPDRVWSSVRNFWLENGFVLEKEDSSAGVMETDWAENRADIPSGIIRNLLGKLIDTAYSASTRDKFRVRLERGKEAGTTELYLSHRGMEEVSQGVSFVWQARESDPELEAEMLSRVMISLGLTEEKAQGMLAEKKDRTVDRAYLIQGDNGKPTVLSVQEPFSRTWRRTRIALDRIGFTIEDRDRSRGLFYIRYIDSEDKTDGKKSWLSKLKFWGKDDEKTGDIQYLISLHEQDDAKTITTTQITILDKAGNPEQSRTAEKILGLLHEQLK